MAKHPGGRPPKYNNCLDFDAACEMYFEKCDEGRKVEVYDKKQECVVEITRQIPYTVPGLALALGFCDRQSLLDYEGRGEFSCTVKKAKSRIELQRNENMILGDAVPVTSIFDLKNNFGWKDKQSIDMDANIKGSMTVESALEQGRKRAANRDKPED